MDLDNVDADVYEYADPNCGSDLVEKFQRFRDDGLFFDVTIKVGKYEVKAHRAYLSAFSEYFAALLGGGLSESSQNEVTLRDVDGDSFVSIVDFAYTGRAKITAANVQPLLETANYLGVDQVKSACCTYLGDRLDCCTVLKVLALAEHFALQTLNTKARRYAAQHIADVSASKEFLKASPQSLLELLADESVLFTEAGFPIASSRQEKFVLDAVLKYFTHNADSISYLPEFLSRAVHLPLVSRDDLELLLCNNLIASSQSACCVVRKALNWPADATPTAWTTHRVLKGLNFLQSRKLADTPAVRSVGEEFGDGDLAGKEQCMFVNGMRIYLRRWDGRLVIGGLRVSYSTGNVVTHGAMPDAATLPSDREVVEFQLEPQERIIAVTVRSGWMVDQLLFHTSRQRDVGPFGGCGGGERRLDAQLPQQKSYLAYLKGRVDESQEDTCVRHLVFVWAFYNNDDTTAAAASLPAFPSGFPFSFGGMNANHMMDQARLGAEIPTLL